MAEQHYWRVLEYDQNHPATLLYLSGIAYQKGKFKSMIGQLNQLWEQEDQSLLGRSNRRNRRRGTEPARSKKDDLDDYEPGADDPSRLE